MPCPFTLVTRGSKTVAVFGIVDLELLSNVGLINSAWLNQDHGWDTSTKVISPEYALKQTLELCDSIEKCRVASKVLMAQMSSARAAQVIANFGDEFDLVISQSENEHPSRDRTLQISTDRPQFLVTPTVPFEQIPDYKKPRASSSAQSQQQQSKSSEPKTPEFEPVIYRATITKTETPQSAGATYVSWTLKNESVAKSEEDSSQKTEIKPVAKIRPVEVHQVEHICEGGENDEECMNVERAAGLSLVTTHRADDKTPLRPTDLAASYHLKQATCLAIQDELKTDIAMLQERDFFDADRLAYAKLKPGQLQNQLELILWKEDFAVRLHLTGATLKKLLKQSAKFSELDHDVLATEIEKQRGLIYVGIYQNPTDSNSYFVNGAALDETKLYRVAASDFLAAGDTGYSDLATPDVLPHTRVEDFNQQYLIAGLVCRNLEKYVPHEKGQTQHECLDDKLGTDYFDTADARPFDATGGYDTMQHYRTFWRNFKLRAPIKKESEAGLQQRAFWSLNLEGLDFSYNGVYINHIRNTTFSLAGVSVSGVAQSGSISVGSDHKLRFVRDYNWGTFYLLSDSSFLRNSTSTSLVPSLVNNMLGGEAGGTIRIPAHRPSWLSAQYSVRYERQILEPPSTQVKTPSLLLPTPQISTIYGRLGFRAELGDTYLELGAEEIDSRGVLQDYAFTSPGSPTVFCQPAASGYLCGPDSGPNGSLNHTPISSPSLSGLTSATVSSISTAYLNAGTYLNFNWKFPVWSRQDASGGNQSWYFMLTNKGDFYFNSHADTPVQTRYLDKLTPALVFPIWGKLSFSPKVNLILYENKVNRYHYRALQPGFSVSYSFIRRQGMKWASSLAYGAQTTTQPTAAGH
ncbi:MAG: 5'-nucleotidase C-terminal domain-containing protein [Acidobacteriota bacterium]|nr:5'-nucleotidase C-terminal domain-containing protein [Acidobacteriota bacterium]